MSLSSGPFRPAADLSSIYARRDPWIVPGLIPLDSLVVLASAPKTGKTCFATALARAVATGAPFLGQPVQTSPVLWCAYEETPVERIPLHAGLTCDDPFLVAYPGEMPPLPARLPKTDRYGRRDLCDYQEPFLFEHALAVGARLIVVDCLHAAVEGAPLADNSVARAIMGCLRTWSLRFHVSVLVLHHLTKSGTRGHQAERFADSAQILAASSCHFFLDREETFAREDGTERPVSLLTLHGRGRYPAPAPRLDIVSEGILDYRLAEPVNPARDRRPGCTDRIVALLAEGWSLTATEIAAKLALRPATVRRSLSDLGLEGSVVTSKGAEKRTRYRLADGTEQNGA